MPKDRCRTLNVLLSAFFFLMQPSNLHLALVPCFVARLAQGRGTSHPLFAMGTQTACDRPYG